MTIEEMRTIDAVKTYKELEEARARIAHLEDRIDLLMSANADVARIADERDVAEQRIHLLIAERDTARLQADQNYKLREEFRDLLGTDDIAKAVAEIRRMKEYIRIKAKKDKP